MRHQSSLRWLVTVAVLSLSGLLHGRALAEVRPFDPEEARRLYLEGTRHVEASEFEAALAVYRRSFALYPSPSTLVNMAYCESRLGRLVEAWLLLSKALEPREPNATQPALSAERQAAAALERERLQARLPSLIFQGPDSAELLVAGANIVPVEGTPGDYHLIASAEPVWATFPLGSRIYVNPGTYRVGQRWNGHASYREFALAEGTAFGLFVATPAPAPGPAPAPVDRTPSEKLSRPRITHPAPVPLEPPPRPYRAAGVASLIAGGVAFSSALIATAVLLDAEAELSERCSADHVCPPELAGTVDRYETAAVVTNVGLIAGVAATAAGVGLLVTDHLATMPSVSVHVSSAGVRARVRF